MHVVLCTVIVVITSNLIRKITLNMLCFVPCCEVQQIFFSGCQVVFERKGFATEMVSNKGRIALQAGHASPVKWCLTEKAPVKWCLTEKVELLCKLAMPRLSNGV